MPHHERPPPENYLNGQRNFTEKVDYESGQQKLSAECASCLPLPLYHKIEWVVRFHIPKCQKALRAFEIKSVACILQNSGDVPTSFFRF